MWFGQKVHEEKWEFGKAHIFSFGQKVQEANRESEEKTCKYLVYVLPHSSACGASSLEIHVS